MARLELAHVRHQLTRFGRARTTPESSPEVVAFPGSVAILDLRLERVDSGDGEKQAVIEAIAPTLPEKHATTQSIPLDEQQTSLAGFGERVQIGAIRE